MDLRGGCRLVEPVLDDETVLLRLGRWLCLLALPPALPPRPLWREPDALEECTGGICEKSQSQAAGKEWLKGYKELQTLGGGKVTNPVQPGMKIVGGI